MSHYTYDPGLLQYCTVRQVEILEALQEHGSHRKAAKALGLAKSAVDQALALIRKKAARHGYSPEHDLTRPIAPGYKLKGASTLYRRGEPEPVLQWVKTTADDAARQLLLEQALEVLTKECKGLAPITPPPAGCNADLLAVYPQGDPHFGLRTWAKEAGENFDLDIAKRLTLGAVDRLVSSAPAAETAIMLPLGDVLHANDQSNTTPAHKHQLDVDGRFVMVLGATIETYRHCIIRLLEKHKRLIVRFMSGNHDPEAVWALAFTIAAYFSSDDRVTIDLNPSKHWFHKFGKVLIGATHGDTVKPADLLGVMATERAEDWGQTLYRYWYTGHIHHETVKEFPGVTCESFRTIAARDAHSARHGYKSGRDMKLIVHHASFGEVERHRVDVAMLQ